MDHDGTKRSKLADTTIYHSNGRYMAPLMIRSVKLGLLRYRLGLAHFATFETLVLKFQALLQIQSLLLIPTCFAHSSPLDQGNVSKRAWK